MYLPYEGGLDWRRVEIGGNGAVVELAFLNLKGYL